MILLREHYPEVQCHAFLGRQRAERRSHLLSFRISGSQFYGRHGGIFLLIFTFSEYENLPLQT